MVSVLRGGVRCGRGFARYFGGVYDCDFVGSRGSLKLSPMVVDWSTDLGLRGLATGGKGASQKNKQGKGTLSQVKLGEIGDSIPGYKLASMIYEFGLNPDAKDEGPVKLYYPDSVLPMSTIEMRERLSRHVIANVKLSMNNTMVTMTDVFGNKKAGSTAGSTGFKGAKRGQPAGATSAGLYAAQRMVLSGYLTCHVKYKGMGKGRDAAVRALRQGGLQITAIMDVTPVPHNGCRPRKQRRI
mmetsp:Transcript_2957/g.5200  ORF Transcript_2957/g.5200 Transcript_2957/m.5200 type:complete len:241 (-) Transcript_2957:216-938(-)|eukprot:CAMPEP_0182444076 /NCGR_PEP_ID=MMETSP1172-20130603/2642_1 /TAXON_ID=708627 /ORGANISM="Timspurckia oligopyrenoides, Strain CCMP3278" /LENGTH=240 /DNA_ID=CAMNT_0024639545 /DNA_START=48 /DNA_END=770 /DNA_ORIENTATION=+